MRDDIHKGAPVKRYWKTLAQIACGKSATWEASGTAIANFAVQKEAENISAEVLDHVAEALTGPTLPYVPVLPTGKTEAERVLVSITEFHLLQGEKPGLDQLLEKTLIERTIQVSRVLRCHAAQRDPDGAKSFMKRFNQSLSSISMSNIAHQRLTNRNQSSADRSVDLRNWNKR